MALWIRPSQCSQTAWRWCHPQRGTPPLWSCTGSPHWKWILILIIVFNLAERLNLDQTSILNPENCSLPFATSGGWKAGVPCNAMLVYFDSSILVGALWYQTLWAHLFVIKSLIREALRKKYGVFVNFSIMSDPLPPPPLLGTPLSLVILKLQPIGRQ